MRRIVCTVLLWMAAGMTALLAKGVPAGTEISNFATVSYQMDGVSYSTTSNTLSDRVDQIIDVNVVWNDASPVIVANGDIDKVLTFKVTNTGNGEDTFTLLYSADAASDFAVTDPKIYIDTNNNGVFDPSIDNEAYSLTLAAEASTAVFLVADIPADSYPSGSISDNLLEAKSTIGGSGTPGTVYPDAGVDGVTAVDGMNGGVDKQLGTYEIGSELGVSLTKSATPESAEVATGTLIQYDIAVALQGNGSVENLVVTDPIPSGTTYVAGSLKLDGVALTDAEDSDEGRFDGNAVEVKLGTATQTDTLPFGRMITFEVRIE
ncbi:MAG: hypothetical protein PHU67_01210 [Sulfurovum sp.]|nr:hypothetical protein [Sulfurovum sp.]MDD3499022.1 hypothetical protein [Sulfurovum sp.]